MSKSITLQDVDIFYGDFKAVEGVSLKVEPNSVTAFIGPSGCGKSTVLRTINRMHEVIPGARVEGSVLLDEEDIYGSAVDPVNVRRTIGMVFQRPNPFPTMSIAENVLAGVRLAELAMGIELPPLPIYQSRLAPFPLPAFRRLGQQGYYQWGRFKDRFL